MKSLREEVGIINILGIRISYLKLRSSMKMCHLTKVIAAAVMSFNWKTETYQDCKNQLSYCLMLRLQQLNQKLNKNSVKNYIISEHLIIYNINL